MNKANICVVVWLPKNYIDSVNSKTTNKHQMNKKNFKMERKPSKKFQIKKNKNK